MDLAEMKARLENCAASLPREAMQVAIADPRRSTPRLLGMLEDAAMCFPELSRDPAYFGVVPAMYLLGQFREEEAFSRIADFFFIHAEAFHRWLPDFITEELPRILASVCGGDLGRLESLAADGNADEYVRGAALNACLVLLAAGDRTREEVIACYRRLFHGGVERDPTFPWDSLVVCCMEIHPAELMSDILGAFADNLVDPSSVSLGDVEACLAEDRTEVLSRLREAQEGLVTDAVADLEPWIEYGPSPATGPLEGEGEEDCEQPFEEAPASLVRQAPKIGRNSPCPCGSGRKYKRCCGR
jgi:hypothetical protein